MYPNFSQASCKSYIGMLYFLAFSNLLLLAFLSRASTMVTSFVRLSLTSRLKCSNKNFSNFGFRNPVNTTVPSGLDFFEALTILTCAKINSNYSLLSSSPFFIIVALLLLIPGISIREFISIL